MKLLKYFWSDSVITCSVALKLMGCESWRCFSQKFNTTSLIKTGWRRRIHPWVSFQILKRVFSFMELKFTPESCNMPVAVTKFLCAGSLNRFIRFLKCCITCVWLCEPSHKCSALCQGELKRKMDLSWLSGSSNIFGLQRSQALGKRCDLFRLSYILHIGHTVVVLSLHFTLPLCSLARQGAQSRSCFHT